MRKIIWYIKHYLMLLTGLLLMSMSVALAKVATLGTSPISSIPNVLSFLVPLTIGQITIVFMIIIIFLEFLVLRSEFSWINIIQLVPSLLFGLFIDLFVRWMSFVNFDYYWERLGATLLSIFILALGVLFEVNSKTVVMAGEGIAAAMALRWEKPFGVMKVRCDLTMMLVAAIISLVFFRDLVGIREGTVLSALLTGRLESMMEQQLPGFIFWLRN